MIKQNPFSLYDFLGYFIPGALVVYLSLLIYNDTSISDIANLNQNKSFQLDNFLLFIIVSYSLGHLINFISSITVEKYSNWKYNYPSKYLMNLKPDHKYWTGTSKIILWKVILLLIILPVAFFDLVLGEMFNFKAFYTKAADNYIIEAVKLKGVILLKQLGAPVTKTLREYDFHRIFSHYVYENAKNHQFKLTNYVALYGFLRALSFICVIFFWLAMFKLICSIFTDSSLTSYWQNNQDIIVYVLATASMSYIFFMAFMKFYRRYSLESLMLIVIDKELVDDELKRVNMNDKK